jgi:hypothetical protein
MTDTPRQVSSTLTLKGPYDDNYVKQDKFGVESTIWSPCGKEGMLNINSEIRVTPLDSSKAALMTVRDESNSTIWAVWQSVEIAWQECQEAENMG